MRETLDFLLFDWLETERLLDRPRYADHSRETLVSVLDLCERLARELFAPANRTTDLEPPRLDAGRVVLPEATALAARAYVESGMLAATQDHAVGGLQLPFVVERAANGFFSKASVGIANYPLIAAANAALLMAHASARQKSVFAGGIYEGRAFGTMCLSEPHAGSSLSDITTRANPDGDASAADDPLGARYRLRGAKMWISAGAHELTENIFHLVLAKAADATGETAPGARSISLFLVPRYLVAADGAPTGVENDVQLVGLNHKMGSRGTVNMALNFGLAPRPGETPGAVGYLVGRVGQGLALMFHMMNEMRIAVGMGATMLGFAGYEAALDYARQRVQGRPVGRQGKDPAAPQRRIIEHADVKRMLLAQKSYCEGALALELYCSRLIDDQRTASPAEAAAAGLLLEILTPVAKSWPSEWCVEANSLAIQVHGGYGYTPDFPVEQHWRDNRINMIHEGTHGIQALDLLNRKVRLDGGAAFDALATLMRRTAARAAGCDALAEHAAALDDAVARLEATTRAAWASGEPEVALANATPYLQGFGHVVLAWIWLDVALAALHRLNPGPLHDGKLAAARYFFRYELPKVPAWLGVVAARDPTCREVDEASL